MIRGYFNSASGWPAPWVRVFLYLPGIVEEWKPVEFLLDTGCSVTGLQPLDAIFRVGVPLDRIMDPNQWPSIQETRGVGGSLRNYPVPAYYALYDDAGRWEYVTGQILVAEFDGGASRAR